MHLRRELPFSLWPGATAASPVSSRWSGAAGSWFRPPTGTRRSSDASRRTTGREPGSLSGSPGSAGGESTWRSFPPTARTPMRFAAAANGCILEQRVILRSPYVQIAGDWDSYWSGLSKNLRGTIKRCRNRLADLGETSVRVHQEGADLESLLTTAFELEASGWKGDEGTAISRARRPPASTGASPLGPPSAAFCGSPSSAPGGRPIAFNYAIEDNGCEHLLKLGHDAELNRFRTRHRAHGRGLCNRPSSAGSTATTSAGATMPTSSAGRRNYDARCGCRPLPQQPPAAPTASFRCTAGARRSGRGSSRTPCGGDSADDCRDRHR